MNRPASSPELLPAGAPRGGRGPLGAGFSLIEIIVVVGLLSLITLGLLMMFNQTQRVFRTGLTQVDVLEGGRIVTDMMTRELAQIRASYRPNGVNFFSETAPVNPLLQALPGSGQPARTNMLNDLFFLTRENQTWTGVGYLIRPVTNGVGTLYRFEEKSTAAQGPDLLFARFYSTDPTNMSRVLDGVVHFKVRTYDPGGGWITSEINPALGNSDIRFSGFVPGEIGRYDFRSNAVPAAVELEIGILEDRALRRALSIPDGTAQRRFLQDQAGKVHLFRLRVPVRNVDLGAYS
jgi:hypothetical protein